MRFARQTLVAGATLVLGSLVAPAAHAQFQKPEDAVTYRKAAFTVMGNHFGRIGAMVNGRVPFDANAAQVNADVVQTMSRLPFAGFIDGTQSLPGSKALPEVWSKADGFKAGAQKMQEEIAKLNAAAKTGNLETLKTAFGAAGATCKACHDDYRAK
jgi:cytochrome c556